MERGASKNHAGRWGNWRSVSCSKTKEGSSLSEKKGRKKEEAEIKEVHAECGGF